MTGPVTALAGLSLVAGMLTVAPAANAMPAAVPSGSVAASRPLEASDLPSAKLTARLRQVKVEALSERTEASTTWANPDGTISTEMNSGPVRFRDGRTWRDIDDTLVRGLDGSVRPKAHPQDLVLFGGDTTLAARSRTGDRNLLIADAGAPAVTVGWKGTMPVPELDGNRATYREVQPGVDVVVRATATGFEQYTVLKIRPTGPVSFTLPLKLTGATARRTTAGDVEFVDAAGTVVGNMPAPKMWGAAVDPVAQTPARSAPVGFTLTSRAYGVDVTLTPDPEFLANPAVTYPVTIDPDVAFHTTFDTHVTQYVTTDQSAELELKVGYDGNVVHRTYVNFNPTPILGKHVVEAHMGLYNSYSASCAHQPVSIYGANPATTATRWTNQPGVLGSLRGQTTSSKGRPGCSDPGYIATAGHALDAMAQGWADGSATNVGVYLRAPDETNVAQYKRFKSGNNTNYRPYMYVTYNSYPTTPDGYGASPGGAYTVGSTTTRYLSSLTPILKARVADPDGGDLHAVFDVLEGATVVAGASGLVGGTAASGGWSNVTVPAGLLVHGHTYTFRARGHDGTVTSAGYRTSPALTIDTTAPPAPTVSSTAYPAGTWAGATGTAGVFTFTPADTDTGWVMYGLDEPTPSAAVAATGTAPVSVNITPTRQGSQTLYVQTKDKAGNTSPLTQYAIKVGNAAVTAPVEGRTTTRRLQLSAEGKPVYTSMRWEYRRADTDTWATIPAAHLVRKSDGAAVSWPVPVTAGVPADLTWDVPATLAATTGNTVAAGPVQVRAVFVASPDAASDPVRITVDPDADGAATTEVGPGVVNLLTGDHSISATDASVFGMSITRTASSRRPDAGVTGAGREGMVAPFGPQWLAGGIAEDTDSAYQMVRKTSTTSVEVVFDDDTVIGFTKATTANAWTPQVGAEDLTLTGSLSSGGFTLTDTDGVTTTFAKPDAASSIYTVTSSAGTEANSTTQYVYENVTVAGGSKARLWRMLAPTTAVSPLSACNTAAGTAPPTGCRVLELVYATTTTATGTTPGTFGAVAGQVTQVKVWATTPGSTGTTATVLAQYAYDSTGKLRDVWDPRISPALRTGYGYDSAGRVTTITPPGEQPWTFAYGQAGPATDTNTGRLLKASRPTLAPGTKNTVNGTAHTSVVYDVPLTTADGGPHTMAAGDVAAWGQADRPTDATAVFPADQVPAAHTGRGNLSTGSYGRAEVHYLNLDGAEVNIAQPGGHIDATEHDQFGNTTRELTPANRALALSNTDPALDRLGIRNLSTAARAHLLSTTSLYSSDGEQLIDTHGPLHEITLEAAVAATSTQPALEAGATAPARAHTTNIYDQGRPTDGTAKAQNLITRTETGARIDGYPTDADVRASASSYDWTLGLPTTTVDDPGGLAITRSTTYDSQGRVVDTVMPKSNGTDAGTTRTTYYTATGTAPCGGRPEWADLVCQTAPRAAITGGGSNPTELVTTTTEYGLYGQITKSVETANSVTRTTTTTYDTAGRPTTMAITGGVGTNVPTITTGYDTATGDPITTTASTGGVITREYDTLGRQGDYTDADGNTTTTEYDTLDRPTKVTDEAPSVTTYTYNTDPGTGGDPRGLLTAMNDSVAGTFTATYNPDGQLVTQNMPGGITLTQTTDEVGSPASRTYTKTGVTDPLLNDQATESVHGQRLIRSGISIQGYSYDKTGRLTTVDDTVSNGADATCTQRRYLFDDNSNRAGLTTATAAAGAPCPTATAPTATVSYDTADRLIATGYSYDAYGRTTNLPGGVTNAFYTNDLVRQQTAGTSRQTWNLDPALRFRSFTAETNTNGSWTQTASKINHYGSDSDSPDWITENTTTGAITRNVSGVGGDLAATTTATGDVKLHVVNLHGDINLVVPANGDPVTVLDADEYGNPRMGQSATRYTWLGAKQRSTETPTGTILMGVRLYHPGTGRFLQVDPIDGGSANAYDYAYQDPINVFDLDGRCPYCPSAIGWSWIDRKSRSKTVQSANRNALLLFVPLAKGKWGWRAGKAARLAGLQKLGRYLSKVYNGGRARVVIENRRGRWHYDLHGKRHGRVPTPHKVWQPRNPRSPHGWGKSERRARSMTVRDMYRVWRYLK